MTIAPFQTPFQIECDAGSGNGGLARSRFISNHGLSMLATFLTEAGITHGKWTFRLCTTFRVSGHTPPIQVRRPVVNGVSMWLKPGDSQSGVKGVLLVTKDKGYTPEELYKKLDALLKKDHVRTAKSRCVDHIEIDLDDLTLVRLLEAVDEVVTNGSYHSINTFAEQVARKMSHEGEDLDVPHWLEALEHAVGLGLLKDEKTHYSVTQKGLEFVCLADDIEVDDVDEFEELKKEIVPMASNNGTVRPVVNGKGVGHAEAVQPITSRFPPPVVPPPKPVAPVVQPPQTVAAPTVAPSPPATAPAEDPIAVLIANQKKFAEMSKIVDSLSANRAAQAKALKAIEDLRVELSKLKEAEADISKGLDLNAMAAFFQK